MATSLQKLTNLFFHPTQFFKSVEKEKDYWPILLYLLTINAIFVLIGAIFFIIFFSTGSLTKDLPPELAVISFPFLFIFGLLIIAIGLPLGSLAAPFVSAGINHLGVMMFGGKNGFFNTFKPTTYAMSISPVYSIISFVLPALLALINPLMIIVGTVLNLLIVIGGAVHFIYAQVIGISKFQQMSAGRAFLSVIIIPLILFVLLLIPIILLLVFIGSLAANIGSASL